MTYPLDACKMYGVHDVQRIARACGSHFFDPAAMRFFSSRVSSFIARENDYAGYIVTSEQHKPLYAHPEPRMYTVRRYSVSDNGEGGGAFNIDTVGEFQQFATLQAAQRFARSLIQ